MPFPAVTWRSVAKHLWPKRTYKNLPRTFKLCGREQRRYYFPGKVFKGFASVKNGQNKEGKRATITGDETMDRRTENQTDASAAREQEQVQYFVISNVNRL